MNLVSLAHSALNETPGRRLIELSDDRPILFVGDTHGDREATELVLSRFPPTRHVIVFLGDAVDRGPDSHGNLKCILTALRDHPDSVHLLMGNHEAWAVDPFTPADFWLGLETTEAQDLASVLSRLPLAAHHPSGLLAVHGALPDLARRQEIEDIETGSEAWRAITWGDWADSGARPPIAVGRRPIFDRNDFEHCAQSLGIHVVVRSHQPSAPRYLFDDRCLTLFTSLAYADGVRRVALLPPGRELRTALDLDLIDI